MSYEIGQIFPTDEKQWLAIEKLLHLAGIKREKHLDYSCAMFDESGEVIATGSCLGNSLRCLAVSPSYQGEGLMNQLITHLINVQFERGHSHLFLYTKTASAKFFQGLGFYPIAEVPNQVVFMENRRTGFADYLAKLSPKPTACKTVAAVVMNANPFTLGHQFLLEKVARENEVVHLFLVSEEASLIPFTVRKQLVQAGIAHLPNIYCHDTQSYMISQATFPSYFQPNSDAVVESNALLDLAVFTRIAKTLGIQKRYVGDEPFSRVTAIYNQIMQQKLPEAGIECVIVPRKEKEGQAISASSVREAIQQGDWHKLAQLVPQTTLQFFESEQAKQIIQKIQQTAYVRHH